MNPTHKRMEKADWVHAARDALISGGVDQVKVDRLANAMKITRGSFYWFFKTRAELLDALLQDWKDTNTKSLLEAISAAETAKEKFLALINAWLDEQSFNPRYDSAVRDWARASEEVAEAVHEIDRKRIAAIATIFRAFGYDTMEALVRARVTYFHQVGYYALHIRESRAEREQLLPLYYHSLTGCKL